MPRLISLFIIVSDTLLSMLLIFDLASIIRLTLVIPTYVPITVANDTTEMLPLVADKTIKDLSK